MKNVNIIVLILFLLVGAGAGFYGGMQYRNFQITQNRGTGTNGQRFMGRFGGGMMGRNAVIGSILSMDDKSITVKLADGSSKIVFFSDSTTYNNTIVAQKSDLKVGTSIAVFGTPNSDGSVTATNVQLNPNFARGQASPAPTN